MWPNPQELRIWSHLLKKSLMENFIFCAMYLKHSRKLHYFLLREIQKLSQKVNFCANLTNGWLYISSYWKITSNIIASNICWWNFRTLLDSSAPLCKFAFESTCIQNTRDIAIDTSDHIVLYFHNEMSYNHAYVGNKICSMHS